jgi:hypothetical protein
MRATAAISPTEITDPITRQIELPIEEEDDIDELIRDTRGRPTSIPPYIRDRNYSRERHTTPRREEASEGTHPISWDTPSRSQSPRGQSPRRRYRSRSPSIRRSDQVGDAITIIMKAMIEQSQR